MSQPYRGIFLKFPFDSTYKELKHVWVGYATRYAYGTTFDSTYKELKLIDTCLKPYQFSTFDSTYKELKQGIYGSHKNRSAPFDSTYKELKRAYSIVR